MPDNKSVIRGLAVGGIATFFVAAREHGIGGGLLLVGAALGLILGSILAAHGLGLIVEKRTSIARGKASVAIWSVAFLGFVAWQIFR